MRLTSSSDRRAATYQAPRAPVTVLAACGTLLLAFAPLPGQPAQTIPCVSRPSEVRELGFSIRGTISQVMVKPGDDVKSGDELVRLNDRVQLAAVQLAKLQAEDTTKVRQSKMALDYRQQELALVEQTKENSAGNPADLREARYRRDSAVIDIEAAEQQSKADQVVLLREQARLDEMRITSPIAASVLDVHKRAGETVDQGTTVITLASIDPLWVDVNVPTRLAATLSVGQKATVQWEDIDGVPPMTGTVIFKSPAANGGARLLQLRVEVPNPGKVPAGLHGNVTFGPPSAPRPGGGGANN